MVLLRESGMAQPAIAAATGGVAETVNRAHMAYDHGGIAALKPKPNGGRKYQNMTMAEEKALLGRFARAAGAGEMLNIHDLKAAYEKAIGHATSDSTVFCNGRPVVNPFCVIQLPVRATVRIGAGPPPDRV